MKLLGRRPKLSALERFLAQCEHVTTPQGRTAHLRHPDRGVLCGWAASKSARDGLQECRLCLDEARKLSGGNVAS